ncbi:MAG: UxaA family hydrolase [Novosphingobium sp.]
MATVLIHPADNVLVVVRPVRAGDELVIDGITLRAAEFVGIGHKLARRELAAGATVIKHGVAIGETLALVAIGRHLHGHNMKSTYLPTVSGRRAGTTHA